MNTSKDDGKDDMIFYLHEMTSDGLNDDRTEEWTNLIDRGGLWHIDDVTYRIAQKFHESKQRSSRIKYSQRY